MTDPSDQKRRTADSFSEGASSYVESDVHRRGDDLEQLAEWASDAEYVLDIATGAGHTAGAVSEHNAGTIVAADAAPGMVRTAEENFDAVNGLMADAERLPFRTSSFDAVTCRIAAHHFPDPEGFVSEANRVLAPGGVFAFEDNIAPNDPRLDEFLNRVERLRDPTHVRSYTESEWRSWIQELNLEIVQSFVVEKEIQYEPWIEQLDTPEENRQKLASLFRDASAEATDVFSIQWNNESVQSFVNFKLVLLAKQASDGRYRSVSTPTASDTESKPSR